MIYLLDTNVVSELRKVESGTADRRVKRWAEALDVQASYLSVITLLELEVGTLRMERRDPRQGSMLRIWLEEQVLREFAGRILPVDTRIALHGAALHVPDPMDDRDALIAATALTHGMTVVTRNVPHFERAKVKILNPWEA